MTAQMINVDTVIKSDVLTVVSQYFNINGVRVLARQRFYNLEQNKCFGTIAILGENDYMVIVSATDHHPQLSEDFTSFEDALISILPFDLRAKVFPERYKNHGK